MRTVDTIDIAAKSSAVFQAAADISRWPEILPHYRWVKILDERNDGSLVEMAAMRGWIPVKWTSVQRCDAEFGCIHYRHTGGATKGMLVVWEIEATATGTHVNLIHDLTLETPVVRSWIGKRIVGLFFVHYIANRTLRGMKARLEKEGKCAEQSLPALDR